MPNFRPRLLSLAATALVALCLDARAQDATRGTARFRDYAFADGERLPDLALSYLTFGTAHRAADGSIDNAVLLLHGTTGSAANFLAPAFRQTLYGPGQPLDASRYFMVVPDGIGAGQSSKPSDGLHARFPHYGYVDQVRSQHATLAQLGIKHPALVLGTSMGGMQSWLWAEIYPDGADAFVAIAATPAQISGRNQVWREMISQAIRDDPDWKNGDYPKDHPPRDWIRAAMPLFSIMTTNAAVMQKEAPTRAAAIGLVDALEKKAEGRDANDFLYQFESSYDYDPAPRLDAIARPVLALDFADDLLNPPEFLHLPETPKVTKVLLPAGPISYGHETLAHPEVWAPALHAFMAALPDRARK